MHAHIYEIRFGSKDFLEILEESIPEERNLTTTFGTKEKQVPFRGKGTLDVHRK